ncbi:MULTISPECIES: SH3 domain-containing protein [Streptomyces]|uniref:SH3 domain-containing protein n=1 Tax=Streptomyces flavovirens TaxID=52258 RepID=A0ABV8N5Q4_9ACTN|nr:SH3 domain-containing protein [Streptomyces sp. MBT51]MBK3591815.1 SH3 domain-containing protein [Streptomyces sp. MBT51]HBF82350.1 SH3 domain-containing protein [Streptomyces sp.]
MIKKSLLTAVALVAGLGLVASPSAYGAQSPLPAAPAAQAAPQLVCTVNDNGVNFRGGPGTDYAVLGTVNRGQNINARGRQGNWLMGDLWGGPTGVWIHVAYLDC